MQKYENLFNYSSKAQFRWAYLEQRLSSSDCQLHIINDSLWIFRKNAIPNEIEQKWKVYFLFWKAMESKSKSFKLKNLNVCWAAQFSPAACSMQILNV